VAGTEFTDDIILGIVPPPTSDVFASDSVRNSSAVIGDFEGLAASIDEPFSAQTVALGLGSVRIHLLCTCLEPPMAEDVTAQLVGEDLHCTLAMRAREEEKLGLVRSSHVLKKKNKIK
jgi:hypothetical protein